MTSFEQDKTECVATSELMYLMVLNSRIWWDIYIYIYLKLFVWFIPCNHNRSVVF